ncbi:MAG: hypothetical protein K2Y21_10175 [Phycisphaerales bacterium]|nr:hypothetical protein [Phycisphaerales bacterium]
MRAIVACAFGSFTDASLRACVHAAGAGDRLVLIADSEGERRAARLGLNTDLIFPPAALRRAWPLPAGAATRSLRECLDRFDELAFAEGEALDRVVDACRGMGSLPPRRMLTEKERGDADDGPTVGLVPAETRAEIRDALGVGAGSGKTGREDLLIALASDPADAGGASDFVRVCQTLALVGHRVTAIVPRCAGDLSRANQIVRGTGIRLRLLTTTLPVWCLLPGLDAVVLDVAESSITPMADAGGRRWMTRCAAAVGIPAACARSLVEDVSAPGLAIAESRLPVHIARALDAVLRGVGASERAAGAVP